MDSQTQTKPNRALQFLRENALTLLIVALVLIIVYFMPIRETFVKRPLAQISETRGGSNYPIVVKCPIEHDSLTRGHYEYKCSSGADVPKQFSKYADYDREISRCDMALWPGLGCESY